MKLEAVKGSNPSWEAANAIFLIASSARQTGANGMFDNGALGRQGFGVCGGGGLDGDCQNIEAHLTKSEISQSEAASRFQEDWMVNLWSRVQLIEQFLVLWTSR